MQLRPAQLASHLAKRLAPLYVVHGDEPLLAIEAGDQIRAAARAAGYDERELLVVEAFFGKIGRSSIHLNFEVHRKENSDVIVATGKYVLVTVKKGQLAPTPVPNMLREKLQPYVEENSNGTRRQRSAR